MEALKTALGKVYELYVRTRLRLACLEIRAGVHRQSVVLKTSESKPLEDEENLVEEEMSDQLLDAGLCGRAHLVTAVPLVGSRLHELIQALQAMDSMNPKWIFCVEQLHWLLLMGGYLISDVSEYESSRQVPRIVSHYETSSQGKVVQLIRLCFGLLDWEEKCFRNNRRELLSPLLSATLLWFCNRIIQVYFFRVKRNSGDGVEGPTPRADILSESFVSSFHSLPLLNQFLELVRANLERWAGSDEVLSATLTILR